MSPNPYPRRVSVQTILVVDDEVIARTVIADYLRECGYRVIEAGNRDDAMTILDSDIRIHIVFTDLDLPAHAMGLELARWIRRHHPAVKVIVTSGHHSAAELAGELCDAGPPIVKPYHSDAVVERIRRLSAH